MTSRPLPRDWDGEPLIIDDAASWVVRDGAWVADERTPSNARLFKSFAKWEEFCAFVGADVPKPLPVEPGFLGPQRPLPTPPILYCRRSVLI